MAVALDTANGTGWTVATDTSSNYSIAGSKPSSLADGEYLLAIMEIRSGGSTAECTFTPASGFTEILSNAVPGTTRPMYWIGVLEAGASEPSTYTFQATITAGTGTHAQLFLIRVTGADSTTFLDAAASQGGGSSVSPASPTINTASANAAVVSVIMTNDGRHVASQDANGPSTMAVVALRSSGVSSSGVTGGIAFEVQASAGATGAKTWTNALSQANAYWSVTFAIKEAVVSNPATITDFGDELHNHGETGIVITGTNFNAAQGDGVVIVSPTDDIDDVDAVEQTATSWSDTSIQITADLDTFDFGTSLYLFVRNSDDEENTSGFVFERAMRIQVTDTLDDDGGSPVLSATDINWKLYANDTTNTPFAEGTGETTDGSGVLLITTSQLDPPPVTDGDPVWIRLSNSTTKRATFGEITTATGLSYI